MCLNQYIADCTLLHSSDFLHTDQMTQKREILHHQDTGINLMKYRTVFCLRLFFLGAVAIGKVRSSFRDYLTETQEKRMAALIFAYHWH